MDVRDDHNSFVVWGVCFFFLISPAYVFHPHACVFVHRISSLSIFFSALLEELTPVCPDSLSRVDIKNSCFPSSYSCPHYSSY